MGGGVPKGKDMHSPPPPPYSGHTQAFPDPSQQSLRLLRLPAPSRSHWLAQYQGRRGVPGPQPRALLGPFPGSFVPSRWGAGMGSLESRV